MQHETTPPQGREPEGDRDDGRRAGTPEHQELGTVLAVLACERKGSDTSWGADVVQRRCARSGLGLGNSHCAVKWGRDQE